MKKKKKKLANKWSKKKKLPSGLLKNPIFLFFVNLITYSNYFKLIIIDKTIKYLKTKFKTR